MRNTHLLGSLPILASVASAHNGILSFPVRATPVTGALNKRQLAGDARTRLDGTIYTIDVSIGTPGRVVSLEIDTGAEEMWVNPSCGKATYPALCPEAGRFEGSSSLVDLAVDGSRLADDGYVAWSYALDTVSIGPTRIGEQIFGIAYDSERYSVGQLGLGPSPAGWESWYPYVLDSLVASQAISSKAFSLDLGSAGGEEGALIFGGIDTSRYTGALEKVSVVSASEAPDGYTRYWVTGSRITVSRGTSPAVTVSNTPIIFHVNSASPISALPGATFTALLSSFPEAAPAAQFPGRYTVPCTLADAPGSVDFSLGGAVISVPLSDFVWRQPEACYLGAYSSEIPVLGANFLRAAYVVFDWDNRELHFANSVRERGSRCPPNLVAIGSGPGAVPSVAGSCQGSSSSTASSTVSSTSTSSSSSSSSSSTSSTISTTSSVSLTLSTSTLSSTSVSSTATTSTLSSTASSFTAISSTLSTSTLSSSAAASSTDTSSAAVSSTESSLSTHTPFTTSITSASSTIGASSSATSDVSSISSDDGRLGGRGTDYNSRTASLESSTSSSDSTTISSSATSAAYDGASTSGVDENDYPSDSTTVTSSATSVYYGDRAASTDASSSSSSTSPHISRGASSYYGATTTAATYDDLACEVETRTLTSSAASPTYDAPSSSSEVASSSETTDKAYEDETGDYSSFTASPTYAIESSSSTSSSSESTEEPYQERTYDPNTSTASPTYGSESTSSVASSFTEEPYQEKTYEVTTVTVSPTYGAESSSTSTSSASESTEEQPYHEKTYAVTSGTTSSTSGDGPSSSSTSSSSQSGENPYQEKTGGYSSVTASPTYEAEPSSSATATSCQTTEEPYAEKTDTSAVFVSSTHVPVYDDKATQSAVPSKDSYQSDDYRDIPTITTILTTTSSASGYDAVTSSPADETTITITATTTYTITACSNYASDCTIGGITTEVVTRLTTVCPDKTATYTTPASYTDDNDGAYLSTSTKTSSAVTDVPSKTCTEAKSDTAYPAPTAPGSYEGVGHRGYGSGPQDDIYHEEEARGDDVPAGDFYHRGDVVHGGKAYDGKDASPEYDGSHGGKIYGHDDISYEDGPKEGVYPPAPEPAYAHGPNSSVQTPSATPAYTSFVTRSAPSASSTGDEYEHVTAGASSRGVPWLLIVCVGILTTLLMQ